MCARRSILKGLGLFLGLILVSVSQALCYDINEKQKTTDLLQVALASYLDKEIVESKIGDFSYQATGGTPECPDEMTYTATVSVKYKVAKLNCLVKLKVFKKENWGMLDGDSYEVLGRKFADCQDL